MPRLADEPLVKMTLNLYVRDVNWFKEKYHGGFTEEIRKALRRHVNKHKLEELENDTNDQ